MEEGEGFLHVLRALRDAARRVEAGEVRGPALQALLALEAGADDLLAGDPDLVALRRLLCRLRALSCSLDLCSGSGSLSLCARCRRCGARRTVARVAGAVAGEIQAWVDREAIARLVAALRGGRADAARALLAELEARLLSLGGRFDPRLQRELLRHGVFPVVEAGLGDPAVGDGCAAAVLALVRFNKDVFVGPVLMGPAVGALVASASASAAPLRALNGLVDAIRSPLVDELHARGELPRLVALLCAPEPRARIPALGFALRVGYYGRKEVVDALLAEGLVKRLLCLQRSDLGGSLADTDEDENGCPKAKPDDAKAGGSLLLLACLPTVWRRREGDGDADMDTEERPFVSAVSRFAVQVEVGVVLSPREKRETKLEILRRVREAAVSPAEEATLLAEVLWGVATARRLFSTGGAPFRRDDFESEEYSGDEEEYSGDEDVVYNRLRSRGFSVSMFSSADEPMILGRLLALMEDEAAAPRRECWVSKVDADAVKLKVAMPGLGKEHVKVWADQEELAIVGEGDKDTEYDDEEEAPAWYGHRIEFPADTFKMDQIKAEMKHGVLKVTVPKIKLEEREDVFVVKVE